MLSIPELADEPGLIHAFSTLEMGSMTLGGPRCNFTARLDLDPARLVQIKQVHGIKIIRVDQPQESIQEADGLLTNQIGLPLIARFADCRPIILYAPAPAVALCHAGWRGSAEGMAAVGVAAMVREYGCSPTNLKAGIGPGICRDCYEVGPEVASRFPAAFSRPGHGDRRLLDLAAVNRQQLLEAGVPAEQIFIHPACTVESPELPSHRQNPNGFRFACLVALKAA